MIYWQRKSPSQNFRGQLEIFQSVWKLLRLHGTIKAVCERWNFKTRTISTQWKLSTKRDVKVPGFLFWISEFVWFLIWPKTCMKLKILFFNKVLHCNHNPFCAEHRCICFCWKILRPEKFLSFPPLCTLMLWRPVKFGSLLRSFTAPISTAIFSMKHEWLERSGDKGQKLY